MFSGNYITCSVLPVLQCTSLSLQYLDMYVENLYKITNRVSKYYCMTILSDFNNLNSIKNVSSEKYYNTIAHKFTFC